MDQPIDDLLHAEDLKLSREQLLGPITELQSYEIVKQSLYCYDLESNMIFNNLRDRVYKFYLKNEEIRRYGQS